MIIDHSFSSLITYYEIRDFYNKSVVMFLSFSHDLIAMYLENKHFLSLCYLFLGRRKREERRKREGIS